MKPGQRLAFGLVIDVGIDLQRGAHPGVSKDHLSVASRYLQILQQRTDGVPQMMHLDHADLVVLADAAE